MNSEINSPQQSSNTESAKPLSHVQFSFYDLMLVLKRRKKAFWGLSLPSLALLLAAALLMPQKFTASGSILPPENERSDGFSSFLANASSGGLGSIMDAASGGGGKRSSQILIDIMKSRTVSDRIFRQCSLSNHFAFQNLQPQQRYEKIQSFISMEVITSGLILMNCTVPTPWIASDADVEVAKNLSATILKEMVSGLDSVNRSRTGNRLRRSIAYLKKSLENHRVKLDSLQNSMVVFRKENNVLALEEQTSAVVSDAVRIGSELSKVEVQLSLARAELESSSPIVQELERKQMTLRQQFMRVQNGGIEGNEFSLPLGKIPEVSRRYLNLVRDLKVAEQLNLYLQTQLAQDQLQEQKDFPTVQMLDVPEPPAKRSAPLRTLMVFVGTFVIFILSVVLIFMWEVAVYFRKKEHQKFIQLT